MIVILVSVTVFTAVTKESTIGSISIASESEYEQLLLSELNRLECPCSRISIHHQELIVIETLFHEVCSSDLVNDPWLDYLFDTSDWTLYSKLDLRIRGSSYFGLLSSLCRLCQTMVDTTVKQFLNESFVSRQLIPRFEFESKINSTIDRFQRSISTKHENVIRLTDDITHGNTFVSTYFLNWDWSIRQDNRTFQLYGRPITFNDQCSCATRNDCSQPGGIYFMLNDNPSYAIPGFNVACSSLQTLLFSTLECFYDQTCIDDLLLFAAFIPFSLSTTVNVTSLNPTRLIRSQPNTTIREIAQALFIEQWNINLSYSSFYKQCSPNHCSFQFDQSNSYLFIGSRILGLYGGLTVTLRFIIPRLVAIAFKVFIRFRRNRIAA